MRKILIAITVALFLSCGWAGDFEDGVAAYKRKDFATALKKFRSLASQGDASAQSELAFMYQTGQGVIQDYAEAIKWYRLSAAQGKADAQHGLGTMYQTGDGVIQDYAEAMKWYRLSAAQGFVYSQYNLGLLYKNGEGTPQDYVKAHLWFNFAAVSGDESAVRNRDIVAKSMSSKQIAEAEKLARECQARNLKNCD